MKITGLLVLLALGGGASAAPQPFTVDDLVRLDRVGAPVLAPDGRTVAFTVRSTDYEANRGRMSLWTVPADGGSPVRLVGPEPGPADPAWSPNGGSIFFLGDHDGTTQLWRIPAAGGTAVPVSDLPLDIGAWRLAPDGNSALVAIDVFMDCPRASVLACTRERLDAREADKATGMLFDRMFIRHWSQWNDGRRSQLFLATFDEEGKLANPRWLTAGMDGDVPSKPFGDSGEFAYSADGRSVFFNIRLAGAAEPWSTNFDIWQLPLDGSAAARNLTSGNPAWDTAPLPSPDGRTLYYLAMKVPGFEADRFGIMALDLATGARREVAPDWDRSAGGLRLSADGRTLYTTADEEGNHVLFAIDVDSGKARALLGDGSVRGFDVAADQIVANRQDFRHPSDLYQVRRGKPRQLTSFNAERLADVEFGEVEWFRFEGWNDESVQGYVMKPAGFRKGEKYPVAFLIHGGPQGAWNSDFHYRWNPQTYAGQGFAVVAINFHGSTGYGQAFTDAISQHWGDRPLEDLQKGWAAALEKYDFLDGDRACALGASYGGYMVYWIAGVWNEPWKCLIDHNGVFDTRIMYYETEELWFEEHENGGPEYENPAAYERFNPIRHVKDWRVPMLVVHSDHDYRIPLSQGIAAFTALQRQGIPSQFLRFPDETHWVAKPQNSVQWHNTVNAWLKRWTTP